MQQKIHPQNYREVVFRDISSGKMFLIKSTAATTETVDYEGKQYPLYKVETSSSSHPFYTGDNKIARSTGQVDKFNRRFNKK